VNDGKEAFTFTVRSYCCTYWRGILVYNKQTRDAANAAKVGTVPFTGGYAMADGTGAQVSLAAKLNAMNCAQHAILYNKLHHQYMNEKAKGGSGKHFMDAMGVVMAYMLKNGCAFENSDSARQNPICYPHK